MTGDGRHGRATALLFLACLSLICVTVDGVLRVRRTRRNVPRNIELHEARQMLQREKRAATNPPSGSVQPGKVSLHEVVLNGTEHQRRAYVHWSGNQDSDVVFILTVRYNYSSGVYDSQLWRSTDYGTTYTKFSFGPDAHVSYFYVSPANPSKMVFVDTNQKCIYTTTDELQTFHNVSIPVASDDLYLHPNESEWMLLFDYQKKELYVSMDFGVHWKLLQGGVYTFDWAVIGVDHPKIVHIEVHPWDSEDAFYMQCTIPDCKGKGDGIDTLLGPFLSYSWQVEDQYIFAQKVVLDGGESHMLVSYKRGNFSNAYFPGDIKTKDFLILDASEGQVFLAVNHGDRMGASLYLSDPTGRYYVRSLTDVHHRSFGHWFDVDMHEVKGLTGTYLANQQQTSNSNRLKTLVSFNKGGTWLPIPKPKDKQCEADAKPDDCTLVLRLDMDSYYSNWILSEKNAPGVIVAHGHYGNMYELSYANMSVFTSHDGGWTWKESPLKGVHHFNILDQGSIITAIKTGFRENTSRVFYTFDEGTTWHDDSFREGTLHVNGVLNEPNITTVVMSVYGHVNRSSPWTMVKVDFSKVLSRKCDDHADYVMWSPSDHDTTAKENCLLGQTVRYKRKKAASVCFNGEQFVRTVQKTPCQCAEEDFECDFGFTRKEGEEDCKKEAWFNDGFIAPECIENQPYNKSGGYRRVGSDKCVGGVSNQAKYQNSSATCPLVAPGHLLLTSNLTVVATGQPVLFHLLQKRGSTHTTQYSWNFNDSRSHTPTMVKGLSSAQHQVHTFLRQGLFTVAVTASNANGHSDSNTVTIRAENPITRVGVFNPWAVRVGVPMTVTASTNVWYNADTSLHFLYRFGDEASKEKEVLTYERNVTHIYHQKGKYTMSVTAVNSISAATKQVTVNVIDDGVVAQLTFSPNVGRLFGRRRSYYYVEAVYFWLERFRQELTMVLGINLDRMALSLNSSQPPQMDVLILPQPPGTPEKEMTPEQIAQTITDMVENETLSLFQTSPYIKWFGQINVTAIHIIDFMDTGGGNKSGSGTDHGGDGGHGGDDGHKGSNSGSRINKRAIYIAVPVAVVAGIVAVVVIVIYRRRSRATRYSLLNRDGAADPFFDEDDDLPIDMSDARDTGRDDPMLDLRT